MLVDILMPFHIVDNYFYSALNSLSDSTIRDFHLILIDDRELTEFPIDLSSLECFNLPRITYLRTSGRQGYGNALRVGTEHISADFTALFNSDDLIHPERFKLQIDEIADQDIIFCKMLKFSSKKKNIPFLLGENKSKFYHPLFLILGSYGADATWLMRSDWWRQNSFFDDSDCLDWRIALSSFSKSKVSYCDQALYFYREHPNQTTNPRKRTSDLESSYLSWKAFGNKYGLEGLTESVFYWMAAPWGVKPQINLQDIEIFANSIRELFSNPEIVKHFATMDRLIKRRYLHIAFSNLLRIKVLVFTLKRSYNEIPSLIVDLLMKYTWLSCSVDSF